MLHIHRSERADGLVDALRALLADPLPDPFAREVVAVPTRGMERWLTQRMSSGLGASPGRRDGVCANVGFPFPRRLVGDAVAAACGIDPDADPWLPERSVWPLLEIVDECLSEPWLHALAEHLGETADRRFTSVRHLADLFDRYELHRPELVRAWAAGDDSGIPDDAAWQAELWRRLRDRIPEPGPAERLEVACARLRDEPGLVDLPPRLSLFGLTRLPAGHLEVLRALAAGARRPRLRAASVARPCGSASRAVPERDRPRAARTRPRRVAANRLLASWGHDVRELQLVLAGAGEHVDHHHAGRASRRHAARARPGRRARGPRRRARRRQDGSLQVHSCHGRARQVEVLRDAILHLLDEDPTLEPRDVIVMCPDIETFAPLIQASFGAGEVSGEDDEIEALPADIRPPDLRVRLADRSLRQTNPILGVVARLIELADERLTASQVLDLADREPVRRRFGFDDDDLARMEEWVRASGIRWGLDAAHRAPFKLEALPAGTWRAGLDRLLVGVTMTEDEQRLFERVLPLDDVESGAIDLAGRFAELLDRLHAALDALEHAAADRRVGERDRRGRRRADRVVRRATPGSAPSSSGCSTTWSPRRPAHATRARAARGPRAARRPPARPADAGELPHRPPDDLHARPDALGAASRGLPARPRRRRVPAQGAARRRRPDARRPARRRARRAHRGPPAAARRADGRDRAADHHLHRQRRAHEPRAAAGGAGRRAARRRSAAEVVVRHPLQPFDARNFERRRDRPGPRLELRPRHA